MSGRSRMPPPRAPAPPPPLRDVPPPSLFPGPALLPIHPAALLEEAARDGPPFGLHGGRPPPHPAVIEEHLAVQHQEIQGLLADNQRLAATHVALKQEVDAAQHEIRRMSHAFGSMQADKDLQIREVYEKSMKLESELRSVEAMKGELIQTRGDIQKLTAAKQELTGQVQALAQELSRASAELQQAPAIRSEIEATKQEIQRVRAAIEYEKKGYAENYEQGQVMEKNLISIAREVEKLRAEVANAEKRTRAAAAAGNQGYGGNYSIPDPSHGGNQYPYGYGMNPVAGAADAGPQYGSGHPWGAYDMQRDHGRK
ncbi:protein FLX-like 1 isoform X1 [Curcuma longa]|uniref:protein FLX-like 1 isoform X1 n=1 Tax=Curcuma longa TaxID=136217 RepID=UPI003D9F5CF3